MRTIGFNLTAYLLVKQKFLLNEWFLFEIICYYCILSKVIVKDGVSKNFKYKSLYIYFLILLR